MPKKCTYTLRIDQSRSKSIENVLFDHFSVLTRCCFQNVPVRVPFSRSTVFEICRQKMCRFRVNGRPIRHIFHRFQNVPVSCEAVLSCLPLKVLLNFGKSPYSSSYGMLSFIYHEYKKSTSIISVIGRMINFIHY